jgi:hypothetical protein
MACVELEGDAIPGSGLLWKCLRYCCGAPGIVSYTVGRLNITGGFSPTITTILVLACLLGVTGCGPRLTAAPEENILQVGIGCGKYDISTWRSFRPLRITSALSNSTLLTSSGITNTCTPTSGRPKDQTQPEPHSSRVPIPALSNASAIWCERRAASHLVHSSPSNVNISTSVPLNRATIWANRSCCPLVRDLRLMLDSNLILAKCSLSARSFALAALRLASAASLPEAAILSALDWRKRSWMGEAIISTYNSPATPSTTSIPPSCSRRFAHLNLFRKPITVGSITGDIGLDVSVTCIPTRPAAAGDARTYRSGLGAVGSQRWAYHSYRYSYNKPRTTIPVQNCNQRSSSRLARSRNSNGGIDEHQRASALRDIKNCRTLCTSSSGSLPDGFRIRFQRDTLARLASRLWKAKVARYPILVPIYRNARSARQYWHPRKETKIMTNNRMLFPATVIAAARRTSW